MTSMILQVLGIPFQVACAFILLLCLINFRARAGIVYFYYFIRKKKGEKDSRDYSFFLQGPRIIDHDSIIGLRVQTPQTTTVPPPTVFTITLSPPPP